MTEYAAHQVLRTQRVRDAVTFSDAADVRRTLERARAAVQRRRSLSYRLKRFLGIRA